MAGFKDREGTFESKYAHDERISFELEARCSKLFGLWAAEKLGMSGADADSYAKDVVAANLEEPGFDDIIRKVSADFESNNIEFTEHSLTIEVDKALKTAREQLTH